MAMAPFREPAAFRLGGQLTRRLGMRSRSRRRRFSAAERERVCHRKERDQQRRGDRPRYGNKDPAHGFPQAPPAVHLEARPVVCERARRLAPGTPARASIHSSCQQATVWRSVSPDMCQSPGTGIGRR